MQYPWEASHPGNGVQLDVLNELQSKARSQRDVSEFQPQLLELHVASSDMVPQRVDVHVPLIVSTQLSAAGQLDAPLHCAVAWGAAATTSSTNAIAAFAAYRMVPLPSRMILNYAQTKTRRQALSRCRAEKAGRSILCGLMEGLDVRRMFDASSAPQARAHTNVIHHLAQSCASCVCACVRACEGEPPRRQPWTRCCCCFLTRCSCVDTAPFEHVYRVDTAPFECVYRVDAQDQKHGAEGSPDLGRTGADAGGRRDDSIGCMG